MCDARRACDHVSLCVSVSVSMGARVCRPTQAGAAKCISPLQVADQPGVSAFECVSVCPHVQGPEGSCAPCVCTCVCFLTCEE